MIHKTVYTDDQYYKLEIRDAPQRPNGFLQWAVYERLTSGIYRQIKSDIRYDRCDLMYRDALVYMAQQYIEDVINPEWSDIVKLFFRIGFRAGMINWARTEHRRVKPENLPDWYAGYDAYQAFHNGLQMVEG